jgi:antagonist of KipI
MKVIDPGFAVTIQDLGRTGYQRFGVPVAGAMDGFALMAANHLVGNPLGEAGLESALAGFSVLVDRDCVVAGAGRGFEIRVDDKPFSLWSSVLVKKGQILQFNPTRESGWGYLALHGGIQVPPVLGSRSTYLPGGWSGFSSRVLHEGDELPQGEQPDLSKLVHLAGRQMPTEQIPEYNNSVSVRFIPVETEGGNTPTLLDRFQNQIYQIENTSRMAYRLLGKPLPVAGATDILSEGVGAGVIQLLGSGQPLVLMRDAQTTGGYLKLGSVITADIDLLAQCVGEKGEARFCGTTVENAQTLWRQKILALLSLAWDEALPL